MASAINTPTLTPAQWALFQNTQRAAQVFLRAPTGSAAKAYVAAFQKAFNASMPALVVIIKARGGDPSAVQKNLGGSSIKVDGLWGPQTAKAMGTIIIFSFPASIASKASTDLVTPAVIAGQSGAQPTPRNKIPAWTKTYKAAVDTMVWKDYSVAVSATQKPSVSQTANQSTITSAQSSQTNVDPHLTASSAGQVTSPAQKPTPASLPAHVQNEEFAPIDVTGKATEEKSFAWVWWLFGASALGGGLWWMFGRKGHR